MPSARWPSRLWIVRHGESAGNVARDAAHAAGVARIDLSHRDVDIPLSPLGEEQARTLGAWFARADPDDRPDVLLVSPYVRARQTLNLFREQGVRSVTSRSGSTNASAKKSSAFSTG
jgi:phosphohistidine phosphatase SixA